MYLFILIQTHTWEYSYIFKNNCHHKILFNRLNRNTTRRMISVFKMSLKMIIKEERSQRSRLNKIKHHTWPWTPHSKASKRLKIIVHAILEDWNNNDIKWMCCQNFRGVTQQRRNNFDNQSRVEGGKDWESIHSTIPDPEHHMRKWHKDIQWKEKWKVIVHAIAGDWDNESIK